MIHRIKSIRASEPCVLEAIFQSGEEKKYDIRQLFSAFPQMKMLEESFSLFQCVQVDAGGYGISWNDDLDISAEEIWDNGQETGKVYTIDIQDKIGVQLAQAREMSGVTQKELSALTGIYQADISKIERGLGNPALSTLKRLAEGMGMELVVEFREKIS